MSAWSPQDTFEVIRRSHLVRVLAVYLGASFAWLEAIGLLMIGLSIVLADGAGPGDGSSESGRRRTESGG